METLKTGWRKTHKLCGGAVRFVESLDKNTHWEWDMECVGCGLRNLHEEVVDFHAPDKVGGTDEGSEGSGSGPSEAVNEPES